MGSRKNQVKRAKTVEKVQPKGARQSEQPENYLKETPTWGFSQFDWEGPWGIEAIECGKVRKHFEKHFSAFEQMTWEQIVSASGGKGIGNGTNSHSLSVSQLSKQAQRRITDLQLRLEEVFSLRLEGVVRIYGIREGRHLKILWYDPYHDDPKKAVCPAKKR